MWIARVDSKEYIENDWLVVCKEVSSSCDLLEGSFMQLSIFA